jgi:spore maturation protein A
MLASGTLAAVVCKGPASVAQILTKSASDAIHLCIGLAGLIGLWSGISALAEESGLMDALAAAVRPVTRRLFPGLPSDSPAHGAMAASFAANLLGLGGAATPLGLRAMEELAKASRRPGEASDEMCTFVLLIASGLTLVPTSILAVRAHAGSAAPASVTGPMLIASTCSTLTALLADGLIRGARRRLRRGR